MLVTSEEILSDAYRNKYAVGAFNVENMDMIIAVMKAAEETKSPVIMQTSAGTLKYAAPEVYLANIKAIAERSSIPVACHLDHGNTFEVAIRAFRAGYTSIMIDGSKLSFEENISLTKSVVKICHAGNVPVEAELGCVGGKEDDIDSTAVVSPFTDPEEAAEFVDRTGCDFLAVAIGNAHGVYKGIPQINFDVLSQIHDVVSVPLVLHGTSGIPDDQVKRAVSMGMCKVNYATDLRIAFTNGIKTYIKEKPDVFDPKKYGAYGIEAVRKYVADRMHVIGSSNRA